MQSKLRTNEDRLVMFAVQGMPAPPLSPSGWRTTHEGRLNQWPGVGGITYNVKIGDSAYGWQGDHVEPGVSTIGGPNRASDPNRSFNLFSCVGNEAIIITGEARSEKGVVVGTHGGCEHVIIDFPDSALEQLTFDDKILVKAFGQGLELLDFPKVATYALDPRVLHATPLTFEEGRIQFPVTAISPPELLGSGLGRADGAKADIDIQTSDMDFIRDRALDTLRLGDFVALTDTKAEHGWSFQRGALTIGVVVHTNSFSPGHGPGITTLITAYDGEIEPVITPDANLATYLKVGRGR